MPPGDASPKNMMFPAPHRAWLGAAFLGVVSAAASGSPLTIEDLRRQQEQVQRLSERNIPATVSILTLGNGSSGSGVIVDRTGLILTAAHVVAGNDELTILFPDGTRGTARTLGWNLSQDLAMARMEGEGPWPHVELGDSTRLRPTDVVVALGHASGFDLTRSPPIRIGRVYQQAPGGFLWTDCTLIGGDSGGPLFTLDGRLVGIHSSIGESLSHNRHAGISEFREDWGRLASGDRWGDLDYVFNPEDDPERPVLGVQLGQGSLEVASLPPNSPAAEAGILPGDVITMIEDRQITSYPALVGALATFNAGDSVTVIVDRQGQERMFEIVLGQQGEMIGQRPAPERSIPRAIPAPGFGPGDSPPRGRRGEAFLGVQFADGPGGVSIASVVPDSPAEAGGIRRGDIVRAIGRRPVRTSAEFLDAIAGRRPGDTVRVSVSRAGRSLDRRITLGRRPS